MAHDQSKFGSVNCQHEPILEHQNIKSKKGASMKQIICGLILLFATALFAQQQGQQPPEGTPPTFPRDQAPEERNPPDQAPAQELSTTEVQHQIQEGLNS